MFDSTNIELKFSSTNASLIGSHNLSLNIIVSTSSGGIYNQSIIYTLVIYQIIYKAKNTPPYFTSNLENLKIYAG